jgi:SAM-dependent methyltransferase
MSYEEDPASVYDAIYTQMKDYPAEARRIHELISSYGRPDSERLLDVACGTGLHALELGKWYLVDGLDLSPAQLAVARERLPARVTLFERDMRDFDLGRRYDAVTCLFSAIGHLPTYEELVKALRAMAWHLEPGGLLMVEPWLQPDMYKPGQVNLQDVQEPDRRIIRVSSSTRDGQMIKLKLHHWLQTGSGGETSLKEFTEEDELMMFAQSELMQAVEDAGLHPSFDVDGINDNGRGLLMGIKPTR